MMHLAAKTTDNQISAWVAGYTCLACGNKHKWELDASKNLIEDAVFSVQLSMYEHERIDCPENEG